MDDSDFPSDTIEEHGYFVGIAENVGHAMTFKILTSSTDKILCSSNVRPANDPTSLNIRADPLTVPKVVQSLREEEDKLETIPHRPGGDTKISNPPPTPRIPIVDPQTL